MTVSFRNAARGLSAGLLLLTLTLAGCAGDTPPAGLSDPLEPAVSQPVDPVDPDVSDPVDPAASGDSEGETSVYENQYLRFSLPAGWSYNEQHSNEQARMAFFTPDDASGSMPSNVNIQVLNLENGSAGMDYDDPEVQDSFHQFMLTDGNLPPEAQDAPFSAFQTDNGLYIYMIDFERPVGENSVHQYAYFVMNQKYPLAIWATDWKDGCTPAVDEVAKLMYDTLELL